MTNPTVVLNVVGLDRATLKHMPNLASVGAVTDLIPVLPAVTCSASHHVDRKVSRGAWGGREWVV